MMEMMSNLSDDTENDLPPSQTRNNIHHRRQRHHHPIGSVAAASNSNPHLDIPVRINSKYAKQNKQLRQSSSSLNKLVLFVALPAISCAVGFFWMMSSLDTSNSQHLRHENIAIANSTNRMDSLSGISSPEMKRINKSTSKRVAAESAHRNKVEALSGHNVNSTQLKHPNDESIMQVTNTGLWRSEHLSRQETFSLETPKKRTTNGAATLGKSDPQLQKEASISNHMKQPLTVTLEGWNDSPMACRLPFARAKNIYGPMKNIDPDYGRITYESIRNDTNFSRSISTNVDGITTGGFDSNSLIETPLMKKKRQSDGNHHPLGRIEEFNPKLKDVDSNQLSQFFDDDRVRIVDHNENDAGDDDDESRDDDKGASSDTTKNEIGACRAMDWEYGYYPTCKFFAVRILRNYDFFLTRK